MIDKDSMYNTPRAYIFICSAVLDWLEKQGPLRAWKSARAPRQSSCTIIWTRARSSMLCEPASRSDMKRYVRTGDAVRDASCEFSSTGTAQSQGPPCRGDARVAYNAMPEEGVLVWWRL